MNILVLNAGSSSQKSCLYHLIDPLPVTPPEPLWEASIDWTLQQGMAGIKIKTHTGAIVREEVPAADRAQIIKRLFTSLWEGETQVIQHPGEIGMVGHRVVHGGSEYQQPTRITPAVKEAIDRLAVFAPSHNPVNLEGIEITEQILGSEIPQVAVFDTAFHRQMPLAATVYPIPYEYFEQGIRRYGFHGISHEYCAHRAATLLGRDLASLRLIICHLGNGCSLSAVKGGVSVDTTMGFTPLEGLMMGSRSGSIDPGILIHWLRQGKYSVDDLDRMLNKASGLKGVSGVGSDLRQIEGAVAKGDPQAILAVDVFIHRLRSCMGSMLASLGGLDALVFTAGIGENSPEVRSTACEGFAFLGLQVDPAKNGRSSEDQDIATPDSAVRVLVIHTQEDWAIAQACWKLMNTTSA
ncbi:MAG: acetate kinase [Leptolyngbyaceae cyanobacterium bins.59]|nr:acetate kinase [Leptolyngbyaceae cyanobacterium bins.59]